MLWTDESKFNRFGSDGKQYVRRPQNQELSPRYTLKTVKHGGGKVIVWGSFSWCDVDPLHRTQGTIDQHIYQEILENVMLPYAKENLLWFESSNKTTTLSTPPKVLKCGLTVRRLMYWSGPHSHQT